MSGAKKKQERRDLQMDLGMTEKQKQDLKAQKAKRRNTILAIVGGVVAVALVVALLIWNSGIIPRHTTALTVKDHKLSLADMDYYYHQAMNNYISSEQYMAQIYTQSGMEYETTFDPSVDPREQVMPDDQTKTFHDYFKEQAKEDATQVCALYDAAKTANYALSEDAQSQLDTAMSSLDDQVRQYGYGSRDAFLKLVYGRNMTSGIYMDNLEMNVLAYDYQTHVTEEMKDYSDEELKAYYDANPGTLDSYDYDYVYFDGTVATTDADGNAVEVTDEQKTAAMDEAQKKAEALLTAVADAKNTTPAEGEEPATFATVATAQGATASPRTGVMGANFASAPYAEWLTDSARQDGDTDKFEVENAGWYVVQFHKRYLNNDPTMDVRHILLSTAMEDDPATEDVDESTQEPTEERIAEVKAQAQAILDEFNAGEKTAEAFGALAEEHSEDGRDQEGNLSTPGGLYEKLSKETNFVQPFKDWYLDPARKAGDTGLVQTDYGWHVMYFQGSNRPAWMDQAESAKQSDDQKAFMDNAQEGYEAVEGSGWSDVGLS